MGHLEIQRRALGAEICLSLGLHTHICSLGCQGDDTASLATFSVYF